MSCIGKIPLTRIETYIEYILTKITSSLCQYTKIHTKVKYLRFLSFSFYEFKFFPYFSYFFLNLFVGGQWWRADVKEQGNEWDQYI